MKTPNALQKGFTAVELLITLFIAAIFLFSGYQLYMQVTRSGDEAQALAKVSSVAYEKMRKKASALTATYPNGCTFTTPTTENATETVTGVGSVTFVTTSSCPHGTGDAVNVFLIKVKATYKVGSVTKEAEHAIYAS